MLRRRPARRPHPIMTKTLITDNVAAEGLGYTVLAKLVEEMPE